MYLMRRNKTVERVLLGLVVMFLLPAAADAGWGNKHKRARVDDCASCGDYGMASPGGEHWINSYFHGHRLIRTWGGPNHPLPPLSGNAGFWDQPGWFDQTAPSWGGGAVHSSVGTPAGQVPLGR
jgi:hypothetical protein